VAAYVVLVVGGRTVIKSHVAVSCRELLRHVDHNEFHSHLLPAIDKALLRNPETAIVCQFYLLTYLLESAVFMMVMLFIASTKLLYVEPFGQIYHLGI